MYVAAPPKTVRVTRKNIDDWLRAVPKMDPASPRRGWYVQAWNVREKILVAKRNGTFRAIVNGARWDVVAAIARRQS